MNDITTFGQVFTPSDIVRQMFALRRRCGNLLEPAAGDGAFLCVAGKKATGIEIDSAHAQKCGALCMDFFDYPERHQFDTIIGNPPYVRHRDINHNTRQKLNMSLFDGRSNLYLFFIEKCLRHLKDKGELILITPRDFTKATAAQKLNALLYECGTITDYVELGDARIFADAAPNCAIWRFVKGDLSRQTNTNGNKTTFTLNRGQLSFVRGDYVIPFSHMFTVKVGAVSGADYIFASERYGNRDFVCSQTAATGQTRKMIYNLNCRHLRAHQHELLKRKIKQFDNNNWWQWGRAHYESTRPRIYVNAKTRRANPFFVHAAQDYDGSVLAIFPHRQEADLHVLCAKLNAVPWQELGFVCGGRFLFAQRSLQNCMLPNSFAQYISPFATAA